MMVRLIGAALVAAGGGWMGIQAAAGLRRRARALRQMAAGLALLEGELELDAPPLPQLMARGAGLGQGPAKELFQSCVQGLDHLDLEGFAPLWRRLAGGLDELGSEGQAVLAPLGDALGRYDLQRQQDALGAVRRRLEELAGAQEADSRRQGRVYQVLGLSGGAFLVTLLL